jgi:hypothetical protein
LLQRQGAWTKQLLENVVDHRDFQETEDDNSISQIRVDGGKTCYGLDIAIRLKRPEVELFKVLYLFKQNRNSEFSFKALAENISTSNY